VTDIKDFKTIADEFMSDIQSNEKLRHATLARCKEKSRMPLGRILAAAACLTIVLGVAQMLPGLSRLPEAMEPGSQEMNIMLTPYNTAGTEGLAASSAPGDSGVNKAAGDDSYREWKLQSLSDAGQVFGEAFLTPYSIPEGFEKGEILASGRDTNSADRIILSYATKKDHSFLISEEKSASAAENFQDFRKVDIDGTTGYARSERTGEVEMAEVHWFKNRVHYTVAGAISEEEAIETAGSMR
jgi:hypothetical protein